MLKYSTAVSALNKQYVKARIQTHRHTTPTGSTSGPRQDRIQSPTQLAHSGHITSRLLDLLSSPTHAHSIDLVCSFHCPIVRTA